MVLGIDAEGILVNCQFGPTNPPNSPIPVTTPAYVGEIPLSGIADGCFTSEVKGKISKITIEDGSQIHTIDNNSF